MQPGEWRLLRLGDEDAIADIGPGLEVEADPEGHGAFLTAKAKESGSRLLFQLGTLPRLRRFMACHRYEPFWMKSATGERLSQVPTETQFLLATLEPSREGEAAWLLVVPLFDSHFRFSLRASRDGVFLGERRWDGFDLLGETGDPFSPGFGGLAAYVAVGSDPYALCEQGARSVARRLGTTKLRREKPLPDFCDKLGWCTWDAFYGEVSASKVREGLESFRKGEVKPRWLVLDDGWQIEERKATGERRLASFAANEKFPGGLGPLVRSCKEEFSVERFLVWHAIAGYWGGASKESFPDYEILDQPRRFGEGILEQRPGFDELWWGALVGLPAAHDASRFFDHYHASLKAQGVDGVKVDNQAVLEGLAVGQGGRVPLTLAYRSALEASVAKHFEGRLINCMAHAQETWYASPLSTLQRSSIDFFPGFPASHGMHLVTNAHVSLWFGEFMQPDWDMFQSGHSFGAFHAAARAVSGGPVYVSDKPDEHDFPLLRKLTCSDGSVLLCDRPGVATPSCLLRDPTEDPVLLQVMNGNGRGVLVGLFNCQAPENTAPITDQLDVAEVVSRQEPAQGFACFQQRHGALMQVTREQRVPVTLGSGGWELVTLVPIEHGFAAIGLADKFNSRGAVSAYEDAGERVTLRLRDGGHFLAFCDWPVVRVECDGAEWPFESDPGRQRLDVHLPLGGVRTLVVDFKGRARPSPG